MQPARIHHEAKALVREFWDAEACGERYGDEQYRVRYALEPEILDFADFAGATGKRVLEIGVGMGADFVRWLRAGALATGIDSSPRAIRLTERRLASEGLSCRLSVGDADALPYHDGAFDVVYSWGVLHHAPDTKSALTEASRVLAPGGHLKVMLYHRHSWVALAAWVRFGLLRGRLPTLRDAVAEVESPGTQAFTRTEAMDMLPSSIAGRATTALSHWDRRVAPAVSRVGGARTGWFLLLEGIKQETQIEGRGQM